MPGNIVLVFFTSVIFNTFDSTQLAAACNITRQKILSLDVGVLIWGRGKSAVF